MSYLRSIRFLVLFFSVSVVGGLRAEVLSATNPAVLIRHWTREEGLPQASSFDVTQTPDGYVWVSTYGGVARFDGRRFSILEDHKIKLSDLGKMSLLIDRHGDLLIASRQGEIFTLHEGKLTQTGNFPGHTLQFLMQDFSGDIWEVDENRSVFRIRDQLEIPAPLARNNSWSMMASNQDESSSRLWVLRDRDFGYIKDGHFVSLNLKGSDAVRGLGRARQNGFWLVFADRIEHWVGGKSIEKIIPEPWQGIDTLSSVVETSDGRIAVGTTEFGVYLIDRSGHAQHYDGSSGLGDNWVTNLFVDREGTLWIGLGNNGLSAIQRVSFDSVSPPDKWAGRSLTNAALDRDAGLWVGTEGGGLYHYTAAGWENLHLSEPNANQYIWSTAWDEQGHLWIGTWGGGLFEKVGDKMVPHPEMESVYQPPPVFLKTSSGVFWIGAVNGLFKIENGKTTSFDITSRVPLTMMRCMAEGPDHSIWFGTDGQGLGRFSSGKMVFYHVADGLSSEHVWALHFDETGGLWIGSAEEGLDHFQENKFMHIGRAEGLRANNVRSILADPEGKWWLSTRDGIVSIVESDLLDRVRQNGPPLKCRLFTTSDGLPSMECSGEGCVLKNGTLLFPTKAGLARTRPGNIISNEMPPQTIIESLAVGDQVYDVSGGNPVTIPPGAQHYIFSFTAPSFIASEHALFRYLLVGVDKNWVAANADRTAVYSFLPPGHYIFQAMGSNGDGIWSEKYASIKLTIQPFFWQTWWFKTGLYTVGILLLLLLTAFSLRRHWARRVADLERKQTFERARARIAQDIHNELGAGLTRISLLSQSAQRSFAASPHEVVDNIKIIGQTAREMTKTMDEIVWAVNPVHDSLDGIVSYVAAYAQEFLGEAGISCRWKFPLSLPSGPIAAEVRHNLFLAVKEALANVARHAQAHRVELTLTLFPGRFELTVSDDGVGFVSEAPSHTAGENRKGLFNLDQRLAEIGGRCTITTAPSKGATLCFSIPLGESKQVLP